jgi:hypothetical protein
VLEDAAAVGIVPRLEHFVVFGVAAVVADLLVTGTFATCENCLKFYLKKLNKLAFR